MNVGAHLGAYENVNFQKGDKAACLSMIQKNNTARKRKSNRTSTNNTMVANHKNDNNNNKRRLLVLATPTTPSIMGNVEADPTSTTASSMDGKYTTTPYLPTPVEKGERSRAQHVATSSTTTTTMRHLPPRCAGPGSPNCTMRSLLEDTSAASHMAFVGRAFPVLDMDFEDIVNPTNMTATARNREDSQN